MILTLSLCLASAALGALGGIELLRYQVRRLRRERAELRVAVAVARELARRAERSRAQTTPALPPQVARLVAAQIAVASGRAWVVMLPVGPVPLVWRFGHPAITWGAA